MREMMSTHVIIVYYIGDDIITERCLSLRHYVIEPHEEGQYHGRLANINEMFGYHILSARYRLSVKSIRLARLNKYRCYQNIGPRS